MRGALVLWMLESVSRFRAALHRLSAGGEDAGRALSGGGPARREGDGAWEEGGADAGVVALAARQLDALVLEGGGFEKFWMGFEESLPFCFADDLDRARALLRRWGGA